MNRTIISPDDLRQTTAKRVIQFGDQEEAPNGAPTTSDGYLGRLLKYIPPDVIGAFIFIEAAVRAAPPSQPVTILAWSIFGIMFCLTPIYLFRVGGVTKPVQLVISTIAFAVWAFAYSGTPFSYLNLPPVWTAVVLGLFTFSVPLFDPGPTGAGGGTVVEVTS